MQAEKINESGSHPGSAPDDNEGRPSGLQEEKPPVMRAGTKLDWREVLPPSPQATPDLASEAKPDSSHPSKETTGEAAAGQTLRDGKPAR